MNLVNLFLAGGGAKGVAYVGVARALEENGRLNNIRKFVGTNTGSIVAAMLCVGFNSYDMEALMPLTMELLHRDSWRIIRTPNSMEWHPSQKFQKYLGEVLALKTRNSSITFAEVSQKYHKELCITAFNAEGKEETFDSTKATNIEIPDAICKSIYIPAKLEPDKTKFQYGDERFLCVYPIHCFDAGETLGCLTYSDSRADPKDQKLSSEDVRVKSLLQESKEYTNCITYLETFYNFFRSEIEKNKMKKLPLDEFEQHFKTLPIQKSVTTEKYQARFYAEMMYGLDVNASMIHEGIKKGDGSNVTKEDLDDFKQDKAINCEQIYNAEKNTPKKVNESLSFEKEPLTRTIDINTGWICASDFLMDDCDIKFLIKQGKHSTEEFVHKSIDAPKTTSLTAADIEGLLERTYL